MRRCESAEKVCGSQEDQIWAARSIKSQTNGGKFEDEEDEEERHMRLGCKKNTRARTTQYDQTAAMRRLQVFARRG